MIAGRLDYEYGPTTEPYSVRVRITPHFAVASRRGSYLVVFTHPSDGRDLERPATSCEVALARSRRRRR